jgi:hypothetical protein
MRWLCAPIAVLLAAGTLATSAQAGQGTGLYAPFPSPPPGARAQHFVGELGALTAQRQLLRGVWVGSALARPAGMAAGAATARARPVAPTGRRLWELAILAGALGVGLGLQRLVAWEDRRLVRRKAP